MAHKKKQMPLPSKIVPGRPVGGPSPADDDVPQIELRRAQTAHFFERGRTQAKSAPAPRGRGKRGN